MFFILNLILIFVIIQSLNNFVSAAQCFDPVMTVVKDATKSVAKLSGKKKKTSLKVRDHGQEEGEVSDKSTKSSARNKTRECV